MKIYIAIWADRHCDTTAHPFSVADKAVEWARAAAKKYARDTGDYKEHDYGRSEGWIFYADYSCEGDCIYVVESEMDKTA